MIDLARTFGARHRDTATWDPVIVIRHGIASDQMPFTGLAAHLQAAIPQATLDNERYPWRDSVLVSGARLARDIHQRYGADRETVLIGHSMGGLVCRVANCFLTGQAFDTGAARDLGYRAWDVREVEDCGFGPDRQGKVVGLVALATPNSGAMLHGQVSGVATLLQGASRLLALNMSAECVKDLTTDRLFRVLARHSVSTPVLSISGSRWSRFAQASGQLSSWLGVAGIRLDMPHDSIVEDRSVDLDSSILPNEIVHLGTSPFLHLRAYEGCTDVSHTNIYDDPTVRRYLLDFMARL